MDERIQRLNEIAQQGDINAFYNIIREDVKLLEHIDEFPFTDTPLHMSASAGHFPFSHEMMILKPSFVSKRNLDGHTPIYFALLNGHTEMVHQLLQHNANLVRVKGRGGMTPLHYAATTIGREGLIPHEAKTKDYLALLEKILSVCPDSITDVTTRNETALHVALKSNNLEAFKFLVGWLLRKWPYWRKILELKDVEGKTILHIAISNIQTEAVSHILAWGVTFFNVNEKNLEGETALDILERQRIIQGVDNSEMRDILGRAGALTAAALPTVTSSHEHYLRLPGSWERGKIIFIGNQVMKRITNEKRNALLVVAALLVTVTFQAAVTPPGGLWQDDLFKPNATTAALSPPSQPWTLKSNSNITAPHGAGSAIAKETFLFGLFMVFNSMIFLSSIAVIVVLVPRSQIVGMILVAVSIYLCICYFSSLMIIAQAPDWSVFIVFFGLPIIFLIVLFIVSVRKRFLVKKKNQNLVVIP